MDAPSISVLTVTTCFIGGIAETNSLSGRWGQRSGQALNKTCFLESHDEFRAISCPGVWDEMIRSDECFFKVPIMRSG